MQARGGAFVPRGVKGATHCTANEGAADAGVTIGNDGPGRLALGDATGDADAATGMLDALLEAAVEAEIEGAGTACAPLVGVGVGEEQPHTPRKPAKAEVTPLRSVMGASSHKTTSAGKNVPMI